MTNIEYQICSSLNLFCFLNIWGEPAAEYRANIKPVLLDDRSKKGSITMAGQVIELPVTTEPFYIYYVSKDLYHNAFTLIPDKWTSSADLCNMHDVLLHFYTEEGKMASKRSVYVRTAPTKFGFLIAVTKNNLNRLIPHEKVDKVYTTVYFDSDIPNKTMCYSFHLPNIDMNNEYKGNIWNTLYEINDPSRTTIFVNGYEVEFNNVADIIVGDYVDIIHDTNIVVTYETNISIPINDYQFYSNKDKTYKQLIHTPKELNPENYIYPHGVCDFFIRQAKPDKYKEKGLYVHRTADRSIDQVTHQDYSIPMFIVDAYRDYLDTQEIKVKVIIRKHARTNKLIQDKNYINLLYTQDDQTIIDCMLGKVWDKLDFWKAENLESSVYINMIDDIPDEITPENMYYYVEGLGYYHVISLICKRIYSMRITDLYAGFINVYKPYLFSGKPILPLVYLNGKKIRQNRFEVVNDLNLGFTIKFIESEIMLNIGDMISVEMFIDGDYSCHEIIPSLTNYKITIPYTEYNIYEECSDDYYFSQGILNLEKHFKYYVKVTSPIGKILEKVNSNGTLELTFSDQMFNKKFIIQNKNCVYPFVNLNEELNNKINEGSPLVFQLCTRTLGYGTKVPIFENANIDVFLNGNYLINELDYTVLEIRNKDNYLAMKELVINNMSYLKESDNYIEVFVTVAENEDVTFGFIQDEKLYTEQPIAIWLPNISVSHIEGNLELDIINKGRWFELPSGHNYREGAPWELQTCLPKVVKEFINRYHDNDDKARLIILNEYFYKIKLDLPKVIILEKSHRIYSLHLATIIHDIVYGFIPDIAYDPDYYRMKDQVKKYEFLMQYDAVHRGKIDYRFVDAFPTYRNFEVTTIDIYKTIHAYNELFMPKDEITNKEVV